MYSNYMRTEAMRSKMLFNKPLPVSRIIDSLGEKAQKNTQGYGGRPYGVGMLVIGYDETGPHVFDAMPTGNNYEYFAQSIGSRSQSARTYLEKYLDEYKDCALDELIVHGLKALKETLQQEKKLGVDNVTVAYVGKDQEFVVVEGEALNVWLSRMDQGEPQVVTAAVEDMQVEEEQVEAQAPGGDGDAMEE